MADEKRLVELEGASFSLSLLPDSKASIVISARARLLGAIDLEALVDDLGRLGNCVRIAYHGVAGYTELQIKVQRIGYDVTKLCDKSAITVGQFKKASSTILQTLQATYEYLLDNFEDMAIETLADITETAKGMAAAAHKLHVEFDAQAKVVIEALEDAQRTQGMEQKEKERLEREREEMEVKKEQEIKNHKQISEQERKAEQLYEKAEEEENKAVNEQNKPFKNLANAFTSRYLGGEVFKMDGYKDKAQAARQEKAKHLEMMNKQAERRREALMKLAEYAKRIEQSKDLETKVEYAVEALQSAIGALKSLSAVMLQAATFWLQMQAHCEELAKDKMKNEIEKALKFPEERRLKFWNSAGFVGKAIRYYAGWVALDDVCTIYMERIKLTQRELYTYIQEALLPDAARKKVKELAKSFLSDLEEQQKAISEKQFKHNQEIQALKDAGSS